MDITLTSVVDRVGAGGSGVSVEDDLLLIHRRMGHSSFSLLERLYPLEYKKADNRNLCVMDVSLASIQGVRM